MKELSSEYRTQNKDKLKNYYIQNKDKLKVSSREYYLLNKNKMNESNRKNYFQNIEKKKEYYREYRNLNKDKIKEASREYRLLNKEKIKQLNVKKNIERNNGTYVPFISWKSDESIREYFENIAPLLHISDLSDWYRISRLQIHDMKGMCMNFQHLLNQNDFYHIFSNILFY